MDPIPARVGRADGCCHGRPSWGCLRSAEREGKSGGAVGVAVRSGVSAVEDLAVMRDGAVNGMEILANVAASGDEQFAFFERSAQPGEEFGFQRGCELAEFEAIGGEGEAPKVVSVVAKRMFIGQEPARPQFFLE